MLVENQLDKFMHIHNPNSLVVSLEDGFDKIPPAAKKDAGYNQLSYELQINESVRHACSISENMPELRQPKMTLEEAKEIRINFHNENTSITVKINCERPADVKIFITTAKLIEQTDQLKTNKQINGPIDYSNLSGYSLRWSKLMDLLIQLLQQLKTMDDKLKSKFQSLQTEATERSAEKTIAAGQNVLVGAVSGAAVNIAWTTGSVAVSARKTQQHIKKTSVGTDKLHNLKKVNAKKTDAQKHTGLDKTKNLKDKKQAEQDYEHINKMGSNESEQNDISNQLLRGKEEHDDVMRSLYATQMFGSSFEKVAGAAGDAEAASNRAQSTIADNERSIHQKTSENSLDMEAKTHKILQAIFDLLMQLSNNTASTNNTVIRAN